MEFFKTPVKNIPTHKWAFFFKNSGEVEWNYDIAVKKLLNHEKKLPLYVHDLWLIIVWNAEGHSDST